MTLTGAAWQWLSSPDSRGTTLPLSQAIATHLGLSVAAVALAALIAVPLGYLIGHTGRGRNLATALSGAGRAVPSFGLILALVLIFGVEHKLAAILASLVVLAVPPLLAGAYTGVESVDLITVDAARAVGMREGQILAKVEAPLGLPLLVSGIRTAMLQVIATVSIAGYVDAWGLGFYIIQGIALRDFGQILGSAAVIIVLAVSVDALLAAAQRLAERTTAKKVHA